LKSNFSDDQVDDDACRKLVVIRVLRLHVNLGINHFIHFLDVFGKKMCT
jgi:hypothetical protein